MPKIIRAEITKELHLSPLDPFSQEVLASLKPGVSYKVTVAADRSRGQLNLYWAGLGLLHENMSEDDSLLWPTTTALSKMLLKALGFLSREFFLDPSLPGGVGFVEVADSIALDNMDEADFSIYLEKARALVVARWGYDPFQAWVEQQEAWRALRTETAFYNKEAARGDPRQD